MLTIKQANNALQDAAPIRTNSSTRSGTKAKSAASLSIPTLASPFTPFRSRKHRRERRVLYMDCELSEKQFQLRYTDKETGLLHESPANFYRAEINPTTIDPSITRNRSSRTSRPQCSKQAARPASWTISVTSAIPLTREWTERLKAIDGLHVTIAEWLLRRRSVPVVP